MPREVKQLVLSNTVNEKWDRKVSMRELTPESGLYKCPAATSETLHKLAFKHNLSSALPLAFEKINFFQLYLQVCWHD